jgi:hypothetical protein
VLLRRNFAKEHVSNLEFIEKHVCNLLRRLPRDDKEVVDLQPLFSPPTMDL